MASQKPSRNAVARSVSSSNTPVAAPIFSGLFGALCMSSHTPRRSLSSSKTPNTTSHATTNSEKQRSRRNSNRNSTVTVRPEKSPSRLSTDQNTPSSPKARPRSDSVWLATDFLWPAGSSVPRPYMGLQKEDDLWLTTGDCLVFFEDHRRMSPPVPSLRVESWTIAGAGIPFLNDLLAAGKRSRRSSRSSQASSPKLPKPNPPPNYPNSHRLVTPKRQLRRSSLGYLPLPKTVSPLKFPQFDVLEDATIRAKRFTSTSSYRRPSTQLDGEEQGDPARSSYEIWFAVPEHLSEQEQHKHKLAIRNLLAMLHDKPVAGPELIQALSEVQEVIDAFSAQSPARSPNPNKSPRPSRESIGAARKNIVIGYVTKMKLDDIRHNLRQALTLLRWTESHSVRWSAGYTETFTHIVGMMTARTLQSSEFKRLSPTTRHHLQDSFNDLQMIIVEAEDKLKAFDFSQMWTLQARGSCGTRKSFDLFRQFLVSFYRNKYGAWPPSAATSNGRWLDRDMVAQLQLDFAALYEYLVDRKVQWDNMKACYRRQWEMGRRGSDGFKADAFVPITDMLIGFDDYHGVLHIPHPYPLLPLGPVEASSTGRKGSRHSLPHIMHATAFSQSDLLRTSMAYSAATNISRLSHIVQGNELLEAFRHHEKVTLLDNIALQEARLGRWILLYGVLQVLSLLSVDTPVLRYKADVNYFLCAPNSTTPWSSSEKPSVLNEPLQTKSYCWSAPDRWATEKPVLRSTVGRTSLDDDRLTPRGHGHFARVDSPLTDLDSRVTGTDWGDTDLGYSPVSEGAAQLLPLQHGIKGRLLDVEKGGRIVHSLA